MISQRKLSRTAPLYAVHKYFSHAKKTFAGGHKTAKFEKVFSLLSFPRYNSLSVEVGRMEEGK